MRALDPYGAAKAVVDLHALRGVGGSTRARKGDARFAGAMHVWEALTGLSGDEALSAAHDDVQVRALRDDLDAEEAADYAPCRREGSHMTTTRHSLADCPVGYGDEPWLEEEEEEEPCLNEKRVVTTDGEDVHEAVQILFDLAHSSMEWGSGMLDNEEVEAVIEFAVRMGWKPPLPVETSLPMVQLALRHPEHFDVYESRAIGFNGQPGRLMYSIKHKGDTHRGGWTKISAET